MRKVLVIGPGGAGKSVLANRLGELLNLEVLHLDKFYWRPGWIEMPKTEWLKTVEELVGARLLDHGWKLFWHARREA